MDTVLAQIYPHWEFCIADDASTLPHVAEVLKEYAAKDARIKLVFREKNGHISAASNSAPESPAPWPTPRGTFWPTNPPGTSIR